MGLKGLLALEDLCLGGSGDQPLLESFSFSASEGKGYKCICRAVSSRSLPTPQPERGRFCQFIPTVACRRPGSTEREAPLLTPSSMQRPVPASSSHDPKRGVVLCFIRTHRQRRVADGAVPADSGSAECPQGPAPAGWPAAPTAGGLSLPGAPQMLLKC